MQTSIAWTVLFGLVSVAMVTQAKPWFCRNYDCPDYTTESSNDGYDVRLYDETNWLTTTVQSDTPWPSSDQKRSMFFKLFPYFMMAQNSAGRRVGMAVPAVFKVATKGANDYDITMMFFVNEANPPSPKASGVSLLTRPAMEVYVNPFKMIRWPKDNVFDDKVEELKTSIPDSSSFDSGVYYRVSYNYPFDLRMKQHEVWYDKV